MPSVDGLDFGTGDAFLQESAFFPVLCEHGGGQGCLQPPWARATSHALAPPHTCARLGFQDMVSGCLSGEGPGSPGA